MPSHLPPPPLASLHSASRKQVKQSLTTLSGQPGSIRALLQLVLSQSTDDRSVRLSTGVYRKDIPQLRWEKDINQIPESDKVELKQALVPAMLHSPRRATRPSAHMSQRDRQTPLG